MQIWPLDVGLDSEFHGIHWRTAGNTDVYQGKINFLKLEILQDYWGFMCFSDQEKYEKLHKQKW